MHFPQNSGIFIQEIYTKLYDKFWGFLKFNIFDTGITYGSTGISMQVSDVQNQM